MKRVYLDRTAHSGAVGVIVPDAQIIPVGTTIYYMPIALKSEEYDNFADKYGIHFIFADDIPEIDFYTVPHIDIFATDGKGGFLGTVGNTSDLESDSPICFISKEKICYLLFENGSEFLEKVENWQKQMKLYEGIKFYNNRTDAEEELEFIN
ncbi:hypothetical protein [Jeotgalibaca sp. A127]|uniref:hypothetical protein n=1 Tax=Jeotgalibaca sp. A127 TaxID=3457324 RepID=UPI003FD604C8